MSTCIGCSQEIAPSASFCPRCGTPNPESPTIPTPTGGIDVTERVDPDELKLRLQRALGRNFHVEQMLGEGGFAVVFAVQDRKLSRRIAVKVLRPELTASHSTVQRFVREAESAANLTHPHILQIFFVGEGEGLVYFGMPYVQGETLDARLARDGKLSEEETVRIGAEIADALADAHAAGLVHRDIKPANILLQGAKQHVLVADFGIAKALRGEGGKLTGTGSVIGSPHYMSPEQAGGSADVDHRSDVYSLGIVLWQMLAGALPFDAPDTQGILVQHLTQPLPALSGRRRKLDPALARIIERACAKRPHDRYGSAADLADALRTRRAPSRRPAPAGMIAVAAVAVLGLLGWQLIPRRGVDTPAAPPGASDAPRSTAPKVAVLPFSVSVAAGDTAQLARSTAGMLADRIENAFGVPTVDKNRLIGSWAASGLANAGLDSSAAFAYRMSANQVVLGSIFQSGRLMRVAADVYDTRTHEKIGHGEVDASADSGLIGPVDRLARDVAQALCRQPEFNPRNLCFDTAPRAAGVINATSSDSSVPASGWARFHVLVSGAGEVLDVRPRENMPAAVQSVALPALQAARFVAGRRANRPVDAWAAVEVSVQRAQAAVVSPANPSARSPAPATTPATASLPAACATPTGNLVPRNGCWDTRANPRTAPVMAPPASCQGAVTPVQVLARVSPAGDVVSAEIHRPSNCAGFAAAAVAFVQDMPFAPATRAGRPVESWTIVVVRSSNQ